MINYLCSFEGTELEHKNQTMCVILKIGSQKGVM